MKKIIIALIIGICIAAGMIVWINGDHKPVKAVKVDTSTPRGVVEAYFTYINERDIDKVKSLYTERYNQPNDVWPSLKGLEYSKIISIKEITDKKLREGYSVYGPGSLTGIKDEDFVIYSVEYEEKFRFHKAENYIKEITVIRKDSYSPWLIDDFGEA